MSTCEYCNQIYVERRSTQRFCCRQCLYAWMHEFSEQKKPRELRTCIVCHRQFSVFCHRTTKYCSAKCFHVSRVGSRLSEKHKKIISETRRRDWANGKTYANVTAAKTKWYDHVKSTGEVVRLQGTWEVLYARHLDEQGINYISHKGVIHYVRSVDGTNRVYLPDFYLPDTDEYLDIKNDYLLRIDRQKFEDIKTCNPTLKLTIITKQQLTQLKLI